MTDKIIKSIADLIPQTHKTISSLAASKSVESDHKPWFNDVYNRFITNYQLNITDKMKMEIRDEWRTHFRTVPYNVAMLAADYCLRDLKKAPTVKDFGERVWKAKEKLGLLNNNPTPPGDDGMYVNRLRAAKAEIAELIKQLDYPDMHWSLIFGKVAADVNEKIKTVKKLFPQLDEFGIYTKTKQMLSEDLQTELLARKKSQSNDRIPSSTQVAGQMQRGI